MSLRGVLRALVGFYRDVYGPLNLSRQGEPKEARRVLG